MEIIKPVPVEFLTDRVTGKVGQAELMAYPETKEDVAKFLKEANDSGRKVITIGSATGLVSGLVTGDGDYLLNTAKMNKIIAFDEETLTLTVEAGTTLAAIRDYLEDTPFFYAPDPGTKEATIGGNVATNAGGMRAIKYGVTRDNIRGMEVVLSNGRILHLGGLNNKSSSGFDLKNLFIGSEGTLGVITKLQLKLLPKPFAERHMLIGFEKLDDLAPVIYKILGSPITPTALEFVERKGFEYGESVTDAKLPEIQGEVFLLLTVDGLREADLDQELELLARLGKEAGAIDTRILSENEVRDTWLLRDNLVVGVAAVSDYEPYDLVVPVNQITSTIIRLEELAIQHDVEVIFFGHAGDGNIHLIGIKGNLTDEEWEKRVSAYNEDVYETIRVFGGLPSAEHGIGVMKKKYLLKNLGEEHIELMRQIKLAVDPTNTLNPGKIFDIH